jgi:ASC-1-like (ASCH) protein
MDTCCIILVVIVIVVLVAAYTQRRLLARMWSNRPVVVLQPRPAVGGGDEYQNDSYEDYNNADDVYGNYDYATYGGGPFRLRVSDPEYTALLEGKKTIEARPDRAPFSRIKSGDVVTVVRARPKGDTSEYPGGQYKHNSTVARVTKYASLDALLKTEGVAKVYPGKSVAEAASRFGMYLPPGTTAADPVMAIELKIVKGTKK